MVNRPSFLLEVADVPALREALSQLARAGYSEARVCERLGLTDLTDLLWRALPIYREERLAVRDSLASSIDLFLLQGAIPVTELEHLFDKSARDVLTRTGLLATDDRGKVRAGSSIYPVGNRLIFSDLAWPKLSDRALTEVPQDQVMFVGTDSRWLARATVREARSAALDLCTGSGIHAVLAAAHARRVVAVDINPRAVQCARFNALVSGISNMNVVIGDLYEPVKGERFDLITANPPFVPSPLNSLGFRDGGRSGEEVQRRLIEGLPRHLAPGGMAQIVTELGEREGEPLTDRLREWLGGAPMDIFVIRLRTMSAAAYAVGHAQGEESYEAFFDSVRDWSGNLRTQGYTRIVSVLLAFQWSDPTCGSPWSRSDEAQPPNRDTGPEIEAVFAAERLTRRLHFREKLETCQIRRTGPIGLMEARVLGSNAASTVQAQLLGKGLPTLRSLKPAESQILLLTENALPFPAILSAAIALGLSEETALSAIRSLLASGLLTLSAV